MISGLDENIHETSPRREKWRGWQIERENRARNALRNEAGPLGLAD